LPPVEQDDLDHIVPQRQAKLVGLNAIMMVHAVSVAAGVILALRETACF